MGTEVSSRAGLVKLSLDTKCRARRLIQPAGQACICVLSMRGLQRSAEGLAVVEDQLAHAPCWTGSMPSCVKVQCADRGPQVNRILNRSSKHTTRTFCCFCCCSCSGQCNDDDDHDDCHYPSPQHRLRLNCCTSTCTASSSSTSISLSILGVNISRFLLSPPVAHSV